MKVNDIVTLLPRSEFYRSQFKLWRDKKGKVVKVEEINSDGEQYVRIQSGNYTNCYFIEDLKILNEIILFI